MALLTENPRNVSEHALHGRIPSTGLTPRYIQIAIYEKLGFNLKGEQKIVSPWCTWTWCLMSRNTPKGE